MRGNSSVLVSGRSAQDVERTGEVGEFKIELYVIGRAVHAFPKVESRKSKAERLRGKIDAVAVGWLDHRHCLVTRISLSRSGSAMCNGNLTQIAPTYRCAELSSVSDDGKVGCAKGPVGAETAT